MANDTYGIAFGMIETRALVPAVDAAHAVTDAAEARLTGREFVCGQTGAVNAAVCAGAAACEHVADGMVTAHIIARRHATSNPSSGPRAPWPAAVLPAGDRYLG